MTYLARAAHGLPIQGTAHTESEIAEALRTVALVQVIDRRVVAIEPRETPWI
jgi:hypothetical protein